MTEPSSTETAVEKVCLTLASVAVAFATLALSILMYQF
jgi:hypothetical protein